MNTENIKNIKLRLKSFIKPYMKPNIIYACAITLGLVIAMLLFRPLMNRISEASDSFSALKSELMEKYTAMAVLKDSDVKGGMIQQDEVSTAIAEIAEKGRELGKNVFPRS